MAYRELRGRWGNGVAMLVLFVSWTSLLQLLVQPGAAQQCGSAVNNTVCAGGLCCSQFGYCGPTAAYCGTGCQSQCVASPPAAPPAPPVQSTSGLDKIVPESLFDELFPNRNSFYTYNSFILAGNAYPKFGKGRTLNCSLREIAAFAAHVQQETGGLIYITEINKSGNYCDPLAVQYPCAYNQTYYGRGPLQLSWNYNYGAASASVGVNILAMPDDVAMDPVLAFKTSLWFWTHSSGSIPSIHDVLEGKYKPTAEDLKLGRKPGFGLTIDIINGNIECGKVTAQQDNRIKYFLQFAAKLGVHPGPNLSCEHMAPF